MIKSLTYLFLRTFISILYTPIHYCRQKIRWCGLLFFNSSVEIDDSSVFEGGNRIGEHSYFKGKLGYGTYIGKNCNLIGEIGRFTSISNQVETNLGIHPYTFPYVSTSPIFYSLQKQCGLTFVDKQYFKELKSPIKIGNDCWIGPRVFIVGGVNIGDGAVILAGAIVTKDVPPYAIVGGVPAKILKYRYDEETIEFLLKIKWWNFSIDWIKCNAHLFNNMEQLKSVLKNI